MYITICAGGDQAISLGVTEETSREIAKGK